MFLGTRNQITSLLWLYKTTYETSKKKNPQGVWGGFFSVPRTESAVNARSRLAWQNPSFFLLFFFLWPLSKSISFPPMNLPCWAPRNGIPGSRNRGNRTEREGKGHTRAFDAGRRSKPLTGNNLHTKRNKVPTKVEQLLADWVASCRKRLKLLLSALDV